MHNVRPHLQRKLSKTVHAQTVTLNVCKDPESTGIKMSRVTACNISSGQRKSGEGSYWLSMKTWTNSPFKAYANADYDLKSPHVQCTYGNCDNSSNDMKRFIF